MGWFGHGHSRQGTLFPRDATSKNFGRGHIGRGRTNIAPNWGGKMNPFSFIRGLSCSPVLESPEESCPLSSCVSAALFIVVHCKDTAPKIRNNYSQT